LVLQYADDTLIIVRADDGAAARLKTILDRFARATGLVINFTKSTMVPMHVDAGSVSRAAAALGCVVEGFPQTYLGLPLSCEKLGIDAFVPLIAKADKFLSGWRALLLSPAGRLVLVNVVLDSLPTHAMAAMLLPPAVVKALDALRRAFLWGAGDHVSGAKCLVAWDKVCRAKGEGGLGVRALGVQNACLLVKVLHRLHDRPTSPWASWRWNMIGDGSITDNVRSEPAGEHWASLRALVPLYRSITRVSVRDGRRTSFWHDCWLASGALCLSHRFLYSHTTCQEATVAAVLLHVIDTILVPRLTAAGERELASLETTLAAVTRSAQHDQRRLTFCVAPKAKLSTGALYKLCRFGGVDSPHADFIWGSCAPSRVMFFAWLLTQARVHTRDVLLRKNILRASEAGCPLCDESLETASHLFLHCPVARALWTTIGVVVPDAAHIGELHLLSMPTSVHPVTAPAFMLLCCWHLWK
jgi:hypothetical protein